MNRNLLRSLGGKSVILIGVIGLLCSGCGKKGGTQNGSPIEGERPSTPLTGPPEVTAESKGADLVLYIQEHKKQPDGTQVIRGVGTHKERKVGVEVVLGSSWKQSKLGNLLMYGGGLSYRSIGAESDALVQVLDEVYGAKVNPKAMGAETKFTAISLGGDPGHLENGAARIKIFYEGGGEKDYLELYTNIELGARRLEIFEKDEEYRPAVIRALQAH